MEKAALSLFIISIYQKFIDDREWKGRQMFMKNTESITAKIMKRDLNKRDCNFYFLIRENDKTVVFKEEG